MKLKGNGILMPWNFKNNPLFRAIFVLIIGILAFELLFSQFTGGVETMGGNHMDMGNMGGSSGFTLSGLISGLLVLLVKILMVLLVAAVIIGIIVWLRNNFFKNTNFNIMKSIKNDPILKTISVVTIAIIGIILLFALMGSFSQNSMGYGGHSGNFGFDFGYNPMYGIAGLLTILVKILMFILVVSLILAAVTYLKNQFDQGNLFGTKNQTSGKSTPGAVNSNDTQTTDSEFTSDTGNTSDPDIK